MNILLVGATGFIGRHVCAALLARGHEVRAAVRDPASARRRFPGIDAARIDMNRMSRPEDWRPLLVGMDAVVNCAGVLRSRRGQSAAAIHTAAPAALFDACVGTGISRVAQISAVSASEAAGTEYARTKLAAETYLRGLDLNWVILRPSLVYGQGSFGGTSAIRGLAALPFVIPLIGAGDQDFAPIHVDDLAETVARCVENPALARRLLSPVGPEALTMRDILVRTRAWLDLPPARPLPVPLPLAQLVARIGDVMGDGPITTTSLAQLAHGNVADPDAFAAAIGFTPRSMSKAFRDAPSHVQDRWHARLYFIHPALTAALALLWLGSGLAGLLNPPAAATATFAAIGLPAWSAWAIGAVFSVLDLVIAGLLLSGRLARRRAWRLGALQLLIVAGYTVGVGALMPSLWADPFGALLKNLPILAAIAAWTATADDT